MLSLFCVFSQVLKWQFWRKCFERLDGSLQSQTEEDVKITWCLENTSAESIVRCVNWDVTPLAIKTVSQVQTIWTSELNKYLELALCSHLCASFFFFFYCFWQVNDRATNFGSGLVHLGCEPSQNTFVGIYGPNCVEVSVRVIIILIVIGWVTGVCKNPTYNGPPNCFLQSSGQWRI